MKKADTVVDLLFPRVRAQIFRILFSPPQTERYVSQIKTLSGLALRTVQEELINLERADLLNCHSNGYHRFYAANRNHPLFSDLVRIVQIGSKIPKAKKMAAPRRRRRPGRRPLRRVGKMRPNRMPSWGIISRKDANITG
jgi:predicted transcriptional regulator